jgi:hypothetical protein
MVVKYSRVPVAVRKVHVLYVGFREVPAKVGLVWTMHEGGLDLDLEQ